MLAEARASAGLTFRQAVKALSCRGTTLLAIEAGRRAPSEELADKMAERYDLDDDRYKQLLAASVTGDLGALFE